MIRPGRHLYFVALLALAGTLAGAIRPAAPTFIPEASLDITTLLPPPPAPDSPEAKADLEVVLRTQHDATETEKHRAKTEKKLTMAAFTPVVGPWFTAENLPQTAAMFKQLESDSKVFTTQGKEFFKRLRPFDADAHVVDITQENEKEFSYPSGHSTRGTLYAAVLAELMPELKDKLVAKSQEIGWNRVIAGAHYPSDVIAGRVVGQSLARIVLANSAFKTELEKIRAEISAVRQKAGSTAAAVSH